MPKDHRSYIVYEIDCSNCKVVYFCESKRSLKSRSDEHNRSLRNHDCEKNEIAKHCWEADQNTLAGIRIKLLIGKVG